MLFQPRWKPEDGRCALHSTMRAWCQRFAVGGLARLGKICQGRGRKPSIFEETVAKIVKLTITTHPAGRPHRPCRMMALTRSATAPPRCSRPSTCRPARWAVFAFAKSTT